MLVPVLGLLQQDFGSNANWLLTSTLLVAAVSVPIMGRLGDMFGKRLMLLVAIGALVLGSVIDALANDLGWLIVGRAIQGASSAAIPLGISLLATLMPRERVASSVALISAMLGVGGSLGLPLAGFVAEHWDWHTLFWINAVVGVLAFIGILTVVPESHHREGGRVDYLGAVLLSLGLVCLILPLSSRTTGAGVGTGRGACWSPRWSCCWRSRRTSCDATSRWSTSRPCDAARSSPRTSPRSASASRCSPRSSAPRRSSRPAAGRATASARAC